MSPDFLFPNFFFGLFVNFQFVIAYLQVGILDDVSVVVVEALVYGEEEVESNLDGVGDSPPRSDAGDSP